MLRVIFGDLSAQTAIDDKPETGVGLNGKGDH